MADAGAAVVVPHGGPTPPAAADGVVTADVAPFETFLSSMVIARTSHGALLPTAAATTAATAAAGSSGSDDRPAMVTAAVRPDVIEEASPTTATAMTREAGGVPAAAVGPDCSSPAAGTAKTSEAAPERNAAGPVKPSESNGGPTGSSPGRTSTPPVVVVTMPPEEASTATGTASSPARLSTSSGITIANGTNSDKATASAVHLDVTTSSGREALLLRFLQLLPSTMDLQQPTKPLVTGDADTKGCRLLLDEVVAALRLWVMQQPLTLGRPLSEDNPTLFALLQPQLRSLGWWRSSPDDLVNLAWGTRAPSPTTQLAEHESKAVHTHTMSSPLSQHVISYNAKTEHSVASANGAPVPSSTHSYNHSPTKASGSVHNGNEVGFEFNENDNVLPTAVLSKRRSSVDSLGTEGLTSHPQERAIRKRRKSFNERPSNVDFNDHLEEPEAAPAGRELRKRKGSILNGTTPSDQQFPADQAGLDVSPKKPKYDDEDYIDREVDKGKEVHRDTSTARSPRGRGRGRGSRGTRGGRGRGGRASREKELETTPKTKARKPESCHRCKNKKEFWVGCPLVHSHKYCRGCVTRHFNIDYDDFRSSPEKYWTDGCPICHLTCPCIGCRRKKGQRDNGEEANDEIGDIEEDDENEDESASGYDYDDDQAEEEEIKIDVDSDISEEKSAENLIDERWAALKRRCDIKDTTMAAEAIRDLSFDSNDLNLPVKKRMHRLRSNSIASTYHSNGHSSSSTQSSSEQEPEAASLSQVTVHTQPARKRLPRLRSISHNPAPSAPMNVEDYLGTTGASSVLSIRYASPQRPRGSRGRPAS